MDITKKQVEEFLADCSLNCFDCGATADLIQMDDGVALCHSCHNDSWDNDYNYLNEEALVYYQDDELSLITVLIAKGPNNVEVPCMLFESLDNAVVYCDELFAPYKRIEKDDGTIRYNIDIEAMDNCDILSERIFTNWYYGCGAPYPFVLKQVAFATPFVGFDLD
jgi:hypothetical protein